MADHTSSTINAVSPVGKPPMGTGRKILIWILGIFFVLSLLWMGFGVSSVKEADRNLRADMVGETGVPYQPILPVPAPTPPQPSANQIVSRPGNAPEPRDGMFNGILPSMPGGVPAPYSAPIRHFQASSETARQASAGIGAAGVPAGASGGSAMQSAGVGTGDVLDARLNAGQDHSTVVAQRLPDRDLFLTVGTGLPCISEQPINTDVPGPFNCKVRGNVMSTSGAVSLLDDGTRITGRISQSLERGKKRAFGVVTRVETPDSCIINLRAPIADQMGTAGIDGEIDTHFFERFKGVALLALFDIASQTAAIAASNAIGGGNGISFNQLEMGGRQLGDGTVGDDVNIPPTLKREQAKRMLIMLMSDIDMRQCYSLRMTK